MEDDSSWRHRHSERLADDLGSGLWKKRLLANQPEAMRLLSTYLGVQS